MTTNTSYESVGTVSYEVTGDCTEVVFTPDSYHCVTHGNQSSAAFVASNNATDPGITKPYKCGRGVILTESEKFEKALLVAAVNRVKVKVKVKDASLELEKLWVPAP